MKDLNIEHTVIDFLKWCNTPIYRAPGELSFRTRVILQQPHCDCYLIIDETGQSILGEGAYLSPEELYDFYLKNK